MALRKRSRGFTLVELLVVISIIGMLMALLLPAIQSAREAGRRNTCSNNMRQVSTAMASFEQSKKHFPGYVDDIKLQGTDNVVVGTYMVQLLPLMERNDLYAAWTNPAATETILAAHAPFMDILTCPSNPPVSQQDGKPALAYVVNAGSGDDSTSGALGPSQNNPANGICHDLLQTQTKVGLDFISTNDGTAYTVLVSENISAGSWVLEKSLWSSPSAADLDKLADAARLQATFLWFDAPTGADAAVVKINGEKFNAPQPPLSADDTSHKRFARPSSNHPGGVNMVFADNHVSFIDEGIDYVVYKQLMTPQSMRSTDSTRKVLSDADY